MHTCMHIHVHVYLYSHTYLSLSLYIYIYIYIYRRAGGRARGRACAGRRAGGMAGGGTAVLYGGWLIFLPPIVDNSRCGYFYLSGVLVSLVSGYGYSSYVVAVVLWFLCRVVCVCVFMCWLFLLFLFWYVAVLRSQRIGKLHYLVGMRV